MSNYQVLVLALNIGVGILLAVQVPRIIERSFWAAMVAALFAGLNLALACSNVIKAAGAA